MIAAKVERMAGTQIPARLLDVTATSEAGQEASFAHSKVPICRLTGDVVLGRFHLYDFGVNRDLRISSRIAGEIRDKRV